MAAARADAPRPITIDDLDLVTREDPGFEELSNLVEGAIGAFQSLSSSFTLPKKLTLETSEGPVSVLMGHTETVPYAHAPCPWCLKFRPQDLTAHEHIEVRARNRDLPILGEESYPDVVIETPMGMIYAWDEIAIDPGLDVETACKLMSQCEEREMELARLQIEAQLTAFERMEPDTDLDILRHFYDRLFASKEHDHLDLAEFVKTLENGVIQHKSVGTALRRDFQWIANRPKKGKSIQEDLMYIYPF